MRTDSNLPPMHANVRAGAGYGHKFTRRGGAGRGRVEQGRGEELEH